MEQISENESLVEEITKKISLPKCNFPLNNTPTQVKWTRILLLAGLVTSIGLSLPVGYNISVINAPKTEIEKFCIESIENHYNKTLNSNQSTLIWSSVVSIFLVGGTIGSLSGCVFADKIGRKGALLASSFLGLVAGILFFIAKPVESLEILILARFIIGLASGLITSVMPMYLTELSPRQLRGSSGVLCPLGVTFGVILGQIMSLKQILGTDNSWHFLLSFYVIPLMFGLVILPFLPESPKYLFIIKKQPQLAVKCNYWTVRIMFLSQMAGLSQIRNVKEEFLEEEIQELRLEERDNFNKNSWNLIKVLSDRSLRLPLLLVCSLQAGQQLSGINSVFYYSTTIFQSAGLSRENSELANIGAGFFNCLMAVISIPVMEKFNRRPTLQLSLITSALFLTLLGLTVLFITSFSWMPYFCIFCVLSYVICYGIALGPIPYFIGSELFEVGPRPSAMALGSMANWGGNLLVGYFFLIVQNYIGAGTYFIFAGFVFVLFFFIRYYLPETRGRDPMEISKLCKMGLKSKPLESPVNSISTAETSPITESFKL